MDDTKNWNHNRKSMEFKGGTFDDMMKIKKKRFSKMGTKKGDYYNESEKSSSVAPDIGNVNWKSCGVRKQQQQQ